MTVMIGVDPHKGSHTAVAVDAGERSLAELRVCSGPKQLERLLKWAASSPSARGRWRTRRASATCWLSSSSLPASGSWTCSRSWRRGCGCWPPSRPTRRSPRRAVGGHRGAAFADAEGGRRRGSRGGDEAVGSTPPQPVEQPHADRLPPARGAVRPGRRRRSRRDLRRQSGLVARRCRARQRSLSFISLGYLFLSRFLVILVAASGTTVINIFGVGPSWPPLSLVSPATSPESHPRPLRRLQRHRTHRGLLRRPQGVATLTPWQPHPQPRHPHGRRHTAAVRPQPRPRLLRPQDRRRQDEEGGATRPQAPHQRRALGRDGRRRPTRP